MTPRKRRLRYRAAAIALGMRHGTRIDPTDWEQVWAMLDKYEEPSYLYAIVDRANSLVKFGKSKSPGMRLRNLKTGNGSDLKIWGFCPHTSPMTEKEVHAQLAAYRVSGEWFRLTPASQGVIDKMRDTAGVSRDQR